MSIVLLVRLHELMSQKLILSSLSSEVINSQRCFCHSGLIVVRIRVHRGAWVIVLSACYAFLFISFTRVGYAWGFNLKYSARFGRRGKPCPISKPWERFGINEGSFEMHRMPNSRTLRKWVRGLTGNLMARK